MNTVYRNICLHFLFSIFSVFNPNVKSFHENRNDYELWKKTWSLWASWTVCKRFASLENEYARVASYSLLWMIIRITMIRAPLMHKESRINRTCCCCCSSGLFGWDIRICRRKTSCGCWTSHSLFGLGFLSISPFLSSCSTEVSSRENDLHYWFDRFDQLWWKASRLKEMIRINLFCL